MMHLFRIKPPEEVLEHEGRRCRTNGMAIQALKQARLSLQQTMKSMENFQAFLEEETSWLEENASSVEYSEKITPQEDIDHQ